MSEYLIQGETLVSIANAIRAKTGNSGTISPTSMDESIKSIQTGSGRLVNVGSITVGYTDSTLVITSYSKYTSITIDDIYLVPTSFTITATGEITGGTYNVIKSYDASTGTLTAKRESIKGTVGLEFAMQVYVWEK